VQVTRLGFSPLKGARHDARPSAALTPDGPLGDRSFCLVDPGARRCLRTVENPSLLRTRAAWDGTVFTTDLPRGTVADVPAPAGGVLEVDYWGRTAQVQPLAGPWAAAYSDHLGREVVLATAAPGAVVYGGPVTVVTTSSIEVLAEEVGVEVDPARFRTTLVVDTEGLPAYAEDLWCGRRLRLGGTELLVRGGVPRCAVVDLDPTSGTADLPLLGTLARSRRRTDGIVFGVYADVVVPGLVSVGDEVTLSVKV